jgi:hypothetical protein
LYSVTIQLYKQLSPSPIRLLTVSVNAYISYGKKTRLSLFEVAIPFIAIHAWQKHSIPQTTVLLQYVAGTLAKFTVSGEKFFIRVGALFLYQNRNDRTTVGLI